MDGGDSQSHNQAHVSLKNGTDNSGKASPYRAECRINGKANRAERFAEIDVVQVRKAFAEAQKVTQKYPKRMADVFKIPHLPKRLLEMPPKKAAIS